MKNWNSAELVQLSLDNTFGVSHGHGNTAGGPDAGGVGNGKKLNQQWTESQKDGNTTFWGGDKTGNDDNFVDNLS